VPPPGKKLEQPEDAGEAICLAEPTFRFRSLGSLGLAGHDLDGLVTKRKLGVVYQPSASPGGQWQKVPR
jgi:hypothetical protein